MDSSGFIGSLWMLMLQLSNSRVCQINCVKRHRKFDTPYDV